MITQLNSPEMKNKKTKKTNGIVNILNRIHQKNRIREKNNRHCEYVQPNSPENRIKWKKQSTLWICATLSWLYSSDDESAIFTVELKIGKQNLHFSKENPNQNLEFAMHPYYIFTVINIEANDERRV